MNKFEQDEGTANKLERLRNNALAVIDALGTQIVFTKPLLLYFDMIENEYDRLTSALVLAYEKIDEIEKPKIINPFN